MFRFINITSLRNCQLNVKLGKNERGLGNHKYTVEGSKSYILI